MANNTTNGDSNRRVFDLMNLLAQEEDPFLEPVSTAVPVKKDPGSQMPIWAQEVVGLSYEDVKGTEKENDWLDLQAQLHGSVSEDTRSFIQKTADELYESGPAGAALTAIADLLPGIPFVDIIDPPEQLSDPSSQAARNLFGAVGLVAGLSKTPQAVGRVATNVRAPFGYGQNVEIFHDALLAKTGYKSSLWDKLKAVTKSIVKDEPLYDTMMGKEAGWQAAMDAREFLYRKTFGLKPRKGKNIFIENADGTLSFNPKSERGRKLMGEVVVNRMGVTSGYMPIGKGRGGWTHSVMGGYKRSEIQEMTPWTEWKIGKKNPTQLDEIIGYEDIWDFKMNPSDWDEVLKAYGESAERAIVGTGQAAVRSLVHMITDPPHIKGKVTMDRYGKFLGEKKYELADKRLEGLYEDFFKSRAVGNVRDYYQHGGKKVRF